MIHSAPHILITRAQGQHSELAEGCKRLGMVVSHIPCLSIEPVMSAALDTDPAAHTDIVLFTSQNAVHHAHRQRALPWPGAQVHAIGSSTARLLTALGQAVSLVPVSPFDSEAYLTQVGTLPAQRVLIIKGEGGRTKISDELKRRNWTVTSIDVYRRCLPSIGSELITRTFNFPPPDIISVGSNETLLNLMTLASRYKPVLLKTRLLVNSRRGYEFAVSLGFTESPLIAVPAGDAGQLQQLKRWLELR